MQNDVRNAVSPALVRFGLRATAVRSSVRRWTARQPRISTSIRTSNRPKRWVATVRHSHDFRRIHIGDTMDLRPRAHEFILPHADNWADGSVHTLRKHRRLPLLEVRHADCPKATGLLEKEAVRIGRSGGLPLPCDRDRRSSQSSRPLNAPTADSGESPIP
jgi:hypothetical protein